MQHTKKLPEPLREFSQDQIRQTAIVLGMIEAVSRPEPAQACPEIAAMLQASKPSEIPARAAEALIDGLFMEAELEARKPGILENLTTAGMSAEKAQEFFKGQLYLRKWQAIARAHGGRI
jgi:hypothetical protein